MFKKLTLANRIWFLSGLGISGTIFLGLFAIATSDAELKQLNDVAQIQLPAVRSMTLIDMAHDTMRSAVLSSIVAAADHNKKDLEEAGKELTEIAALFQKHFETLQGLNLQGDTKRSIVEVLPSVEEYEKRAQIVIDLGKKYDLAAQKNALFEFNEIFKVLEGRFESLANLIERDAAVAHDVGKNAANFLYAITGGLIPW